jgi:peptidoglycan/LPS O-acetylase OafA/YrhL
VTGGPGAGRLGFLDAVRGVAALAVAVGHAADGLWPSFRRWSHDWFSLGRFGVCAFFLVSGFVIPLSLERHRGSRRTVLRAFAIGRVCRLYPLYWTSLLGGVVLFMLGFRTAVTAEFADELPASLWANLTMLQELMGVPHAIGLYYTLTIEWVWYAACAGLFALGWLGRTERIAWAALAGLAVVGVGAPLLLDRHTPFASGFYLVTMLVGTALARHAAGVLPGIRVAMLVAGAAGVAVAGSWANYILVPGAVDPEGELGMSSTLLPWVLAYAFVFGSFVLRALPVPRALAWLGLVSYSVYLLHPLVLAMLDRVSGRPWPKLVAALAGTLLAAAVTHRAIEVPGQAFGRRWRRPPAPTLTGAGSGTRPSPASSRR